MPLPGARRLPIYVCRCMHLHSARQLGIAAQRQRAADRVAAEQQRSAQHKEENAIAELELELEPDSADVWTFIWLV